MRKIFIVLKNFLKYLKSGGVVYAQISQISYGQILKGKRVIITGGTSGIGFAIAKKFISEGANVLIIGRSDKNLADAYDLLDQKVEILKWDLALLNDVDLKMQEAVAKLGGLDILINNAGVYSTESFDCIDEKSWERALNVNTKSLFFVTREAVKYLKKRDRIAKVINISSIRGFQGDVHPYGVSKWGVNCLTEGLAKELLVEKIIVNGIAPGITATNINAIDPNGNLYCQGPLNNRVAIPEEIAELACFLASDSSNNIVGQVIVCDGGTLLK